MNDEFENWWRKNHPLDWWAKDRDGEPLPSYDRLLVWDIARKAFEAGKFGETVEDYMSDNKHCEDCGCELVFCGYYAVETLGGPDVGEIMDCPVCRMKERAEKAEVERDTLKQQVQELQTRLAHMSED